MSWTLFDSTGNWEKRSYFYLDLGMTLKVEKTDVNDFQHRNDGIGFLVDPRLSPSLLPNIPNAPEDVLFLECFDFLQGERGKWWPRCFFYRALAMAIQKMKPSHNISKRAYVAGEHPYAQVAVHLFLSMGHQEVIWVVPNPRSIETTMNRILSKHFGGRIIPLKDSELTIQSESGVILFNTVNEAESLETIEDLAYLNYLEHPGLVIDFAHGHQASQLQVEAQISKYLLMEYDFLMACFEYVLLDSLGALPPVEFVAFLEKWKRVFGENKPSV